MNIGFLCQGWAPDPGGIESHTQDLARHLVGAGHRVSALALDSTAGSDPYSTRERECAGVRVRRMAYRYHDHRTLIDLVHNSRADLVVDQWLADGSFDVVHVHHLTGFGAGALFVIRSRGVPCVMTLHDYWMLCPRGQMLSADGGVCEELDHDRCGSCVARTWPHLFAPDTSHADDSRIVRARAARERSALALDALSVPARLLVPSERARDVFARCGVPRERMELVPYGIEVEALAAEVDRLRRELPRDTARADELHVGVLGSVQPSKGALELAHALQDARVRGIVLDVHGPLASYHGDTSYVDLLRTIAARDPRIRLHGAYAREDLARILAGLDAVAVPSVWNEVFGLVAREAAACGLPILVSDRGGLPEVARTVDHATVIPALDREAWVEALSTLRATLCTSGRESASPRLARARLAADRVAGIYAEVGTQVAANGPRDRT